MKKLVGYYRAPAWHKMPFKSSTCPLLRLVNPVRLHRQVSFMPALSNAKLAAIRSMGMGTLNKLVLQFPSVFWDQVDFHGHAGKDRRKWLLFMDMSRVSDRPILVAMSGGPFAVLSERLGDKEITRRAMDVIRSVYPSAPDPVSSQTTRWKTSRFSRGSFSFIPPGCRSVPPFRPACTAWFEAAKFG